MAVEKSLVRVREANDLEYLISKQESFYLPYTGYVDGLSLSTGARLYGGGQIISPKFKVLKHC